MKSNLPDKAHTLRIRFGRRVFLGMLGAGTLALFFSQQVASRLRHGLKGTDNLDTEGFFRFYNVSGVPEINTQEWRLTVDGLVEHPTTWNLEQFKALSSQAQQSDFECVTGWVVKQVKWKGVRLKAILDIVKPQPQAGFITFHSAELPYLDSLSLSQAQEKGVMLAYEMGGQPLLQEQGLPLRLVVPPMYGYKSVKWVVRLELTEQQAIGFWEKEGYPVDAYLGAPIPFLSSFSDA